MCHKCFPKDEGFNLQTPKTQTRQCKERSLASTELSTTSSALKTSEVGDCLQLTAEALGVIDYLSLEYNRAWRNLHQLVGGQHCWSKLAAGTEEE